MISKHDDTTPPIPFAVSRYQEVMGKWHKVEIPRRLLAWSKWYSYDVWAPKASVLEWLEECCHDSYRIKLFDYPTYVFFEHEMMALQFKLAFEYED